MSERDDLARLVLKRQGENHAYRTADDILKAGWVPPERLAEARRAVAEEIREVINRQRDTPGEDHPDWDDEDWREDTAFWTAERIAYGIGAGCDCGWPENHLPTCRLNAAPSDPATDTGGEGHG